MKVLFVTNPDRGLRVGGVRNKIVQTRLQIESGGGEVALYSPWEDLLDGADICHVFQAHQSTFPFCVSARNRGVPLVISPIVGRPRAPLWAFRLFVDSVTNVPGVCVSHRHIRDALRMADALLALSAVEEQTILRGYGGISPRRVHVVPNGVEARFACGQPELFASTYGFLPDVLFVGRVDANKNLLGLIEALRGTGLRLAVVGTAESLDEGHYRACQRAGEGFCTFLGRLEHDGDLLPAAYAAAKVFVLPSFSEVFPNTVLEAGLAGCNVVLTRNSAMRATLGGLVDYVAPNRPSQIRRAVLEAVVRPRNAELSGLVASRFSWERVGGEILKVYRELIERRRS